MFLASFLSHCYFVIFLFFVFSPSAPSFSNMVVFSQSLGLPPSSRDSPLLCTQLSILFSLVLLIYSQSLSLSGLHSLYYRQVNRDVSQRKTESGRNSEWKSIKHWNVEKEHNHRKRKRFRKTERQRGSGPQMGKKWQENSPRIRKLPRWGRGRGAACARAAAYTGKGEVSTAAGEGSRERWNQREMERKTRVKIRATQKEKELQTQILTTGRKFKDGERNRS